MENTKLQDLIDVTSLSYHLENTPLGLMLWDHNMHVVYCSKNAAEIFGCKPGEFLQKPIDLSAFVPADDVPAVAALMAAITGGQSNHNQSLNRNLTKEGNVIYCQWYNSALRGPDGRVINILSLFQDVTAQVNTQRALEKSEHRLSLAFNAAIDPMWLIQMEGPDQFRFETINLAFTNVTGWKPEQVLGQPIEKIMPAGSHALVREKYNEALSTGKIVDYVEEAKHPSGIKYGEIRVIPVRSETGEPARILCIANDITEKVHLQAKLDAERERRSRQITAAAIKGQESERAKVSRELHDNVNQVLTTVKLYMELLNDQKIEADTVLPKCITHLNNTISEIRSLSKQLSAPSLGNINFKETLTELTESLRTAAQMDVHTSFENLSFTEMENELHLTLYRVAQEQLTNIVKYAQATRVHVLLKEESSRLRFSIWENGVGFDPTEKSKGIGITNMQSRVEILNGHFQLASRPGEGSKLTVEIPVIVEENVCYAQQTVLGQVRDEAAGTETI